MTLNRNTNSRVDMRQSEQLRAGGKSATNQSSERGRALRMRSQANSLADQQNGDGGARATRLGATNATSPSADSYFGFATRDAKERPGEKAAPASDDTVQVLFVLRPGEVQAATPPADVKADKQ